MNFKKFDRIYFNDPSVKHQTDRFYGTIVDIIYFNKFITYRIKWDSITSIMSYNDTKLFRHATKKKQKLNLP